MASASTLLKRLEGKVAIITGGASGIGECAVKLFAAHGAKVIVADIQDDLGHSLCNDVIGSASATYIHCDVTNETDVKNVVDTTVSKHGKIDIMFNNAGTADFKPNILDSTTEDFERIIKVNLLGPYLGTKHAARVMIPARSGNIVMTASICSVMGGASTHAYTSSKHGLLGLMRNTAAELGKYGIRVNCVSPYVVTTPLVKKFFSLKNEGVAKFYSNLKGKCCEVEDVAEAALYLASDEAKFISGLNLIVDGGFTTMDPVYSMYENPSE